MENKLILCVGISNSGKTTWSKKFAEENSYIRLCADEYRAILGKDASDQSVNNIVFDTLKQDVHTHLRLGMTVILDNTNVNVKNRADFVNIAKKLGVSVVAYCFPIALEEAKRRNSLRERKVPERVLDAQAAKLVWPKTTEVDKMFVVVGDVVEEVAGAN